MGKHLKQLLNVIQVLRGINEREGGLLPFSMAAKLMGISKQRVDALVAEGTLKPTPFAGKKWLSVNQIEEFVKLTREPGRPWNKPSAKELWKMSREGSAEVLKEK
ncbi:MAG: hypothetical protein ACLQAH_17190 [Limisphaerales bacterium]